MTKAVVVKAKRTLIGKKDGWLKHYAPEQLAAFVIQALVSDLSEPVDEVILGNAVGPGGNIARLSALESGLPASVPGLTIDRQCGSGLEAIRLACHLVESGAGQIYLAGGVESTSQSPYEQRARFSPEEWGDPDMGIAAESVAELYGITREQQDEYALMSYRRAVQSLKKGYFSDEMVKIDDLPKQDEGINPRMNYERMLRRLSPCFKEGGTITLGNCCGVNDGAAAVLVMSEEKAKELGYRPVLRFIGSAVAGVDPNYPALGPIPAISSLLHAHSLTMQDIDLVELNEAFASKVIACAGALSIPYEKLNAEGGAIAFGHPYGASGAVLVTRLFHEYQRYDAKYAIASIGIGGGIGLAVLWERAS